MAERHSYFHPYPKQSKPFSREVMLLIMGALISGITAYVTNLLNERSQEHRDNIEKKLTINDQLAKDLGLRLFLTNEVYKSRRDNDTALKSNILKYQQCKEDWNIKFLSYQSLLKAYYGDNTLDEFRDSIYNPLILLGQQAELNKPDTLFSKKVSELRVRNINFITQIYQLAQQ